MAKQVLIVDDDQNAVKYLTVVLSEHGYDTVSACDGSEGLKKIEEAKPDLIVLDVMMPKKDGYTVCEEIKKDSEYKDITVLLLTAVGSAVTSTNYTHRGGKTTLADEYIPKPIDLDKLLEIVNDYIN